MTGLVVDGAVGVITIANPAARNALDDVTRRALLAALKAAADDDACRAIVIAGEGTTFCAGGDVRSMPVDEAAIRRRIGELHEIVRLVRGPKPVATAVEGAAFGSGLSLAAASDHVVAAHDARFGCAFGKLGLVPDTGLLWSLPERVGAARARTIALTNATFTAPEGLELGVVDELVSPGEALGRARTWAEAVADGAPRALAAVKAIMNDPGRTLDALLERELDAQITLLATADFAEGRAAFYERRPPSFRGR